MLVSVTLIRQEISQYRLLLVMNLRHVYAHMPHWPYLHNVTKTLLCHWMVRILSDTAIVSFFRRRIMTDYIRLLNLIAGPI